MLTNQDRIIVEDGVCTSCAFPIKRVHHRDFPEVRAECCTVAEGAVYLARKLASARESVGSERHREEVERALKDVAAFRESLADSEEKRDSNCSCEARAQSRAEAAGRIP